MSWSGFIKACWKCGRSFTLLRWNQLTRVDEADPDDGEARRCSCGTVLALRTANLDEILAEQHARFDDLLGDEP